MRVPNSDQAVIPREKLLDYLLSQSHPVGRFKAEFFQLLGYSPDAWGILENDIRGLFENEVVKTTETEFGIKYEVRGEFVGPSGRIAAVVAVWVILRGEEFPRFVTAYPGEKR